MKNTFAVPFLVCLALLALGAVIASVAIGSVNLSLEATWSGLFGTASEQSATIVRELRLPRVLSAFATGGLLAIAGVLMQVLLRNPLADPYVLGVSGGAAVAALSAIMLGLGGYWIDGFAFGGALTVTLLVFALAHGSGGWTPIRLLLTGVVVAAGLSSVIGLLLAVGSDSSLRGMLFWLMGDLSFARDPERNLLFLAFAVAVSFVLGRHLNILGRGELEAQVLGVAVRPLRVSIYLMSSLLTAVAVTTAGGIGFIGLVVPHLIRLVVGHDHRLVVPGSALLGGTLLVVADTVARTAMAPRQLPVGALTALIGVPLFLVLITRRRAVG